ALSLQHALSLRRSYKSEIANKPNMNLRLPQIQFCIVSFSYRPGDIKYSRFYIKRKTCARSEIGITDICILAIIPAPAPVGKHIKIGVGVQQKPVFNSTYRVLRKILALFIKSTQ